MRFLVLLRASQSGAFTVCALHTAAVLLFASFIMLCLLRALILPELASNATDPSPN